MSSSLAPCRATTGDRTDRIQACSRTEKRAPKRSLPDRLPRVNDHRDGHGGSVPGSRPLPCHDSTGSVLYSRVPQRLRRSSPWLNRSGAEADLKELNGRTSARLTRHGTSARSTHACRRHLRPHHDRRVMPRLCGPPEPLASPHKNPTSTRPGPAPTGIPRTRRHSAAHSGTHAKIETKTSPEQAKRRCRRLSAVPVGGGQGQDRTVDLPLFRRTLIPTELPDLAGYPVSPHQVSVRS